MSNEVVTECLLMFNPLSERLDWVEPCVRDATVVDTFAESHYIVSAAIPGSVATDAETDKCRKYNDLLDNYDFQPVAIETTAVYSKSTDLFLSCLAKKLVDISGDPRKQQWLHQRLSLAVVRGNTASIDIGLCASLI